MSSSAYMYAGVPYRSASSTTSQPPTSRWPRSFTRDPSGYAWLRAVAAILPRIMTAQLNIQPPAEKGTYAGIAWCLWRPAGEGPFPAVMVMHGAGSRKENHADFARLAADNGFVALTFDNRGHGETDGDLDPTVVDDLRLLAEWLAARPDVDERRVAARGSSMGGLMAIHAAAASERVAAVVAICPAAEWMLAEDVRRIADGQPPPADSALAAMRIDAPALAGWL